VRLRSLSRCIAEETAVLDRDLGRVGLIERFERLLILARLLERRDLDRYVRLGWPD
jgi:hypothetical protein